VARLAYISFDQVPAPKGASTHIEAFVRGLAREFGQVDLVTVGNATACVERWPGARQWELPAAGASLIDRVLSFRGFLARWLASREYDVIHFRSIFEGMPILSGRKGAALVFEVNGLPSIELKYRYPGSEDDHELMRKIEAQERACVALADRIVTPSGVTREFLIQSRGAQRGRIVVIPNGVDTALFQPGAIAPSGRLLYFGTLSLWQGVDLAVRAVAQTSASLTVLGTGSRARVRSLEQLAVKLGVADRVAVRAPVTQTELAEELATCNAVVAPLLWNDRNVVQGCCPLKILEGMAAGRPVITSDLEVVRELGVVHEEHLLLAKPGSVDGIAASITRLRDDPALAEHLGRNARELVEQRFTWTRAVGRLTEVYRELCDV
jgi:glycosyltransferase involved in cell wall biosynthesis